MILPRVRGGREAVQTNKRTVDYIELKLLVVLHGEHAGRGTVDFAQVRNGEAVQACGNPRDGSIRQVIDERRVVPRDGRGGCLVCICCGYARTHFHQLNCILTNIVEGVLRGKERKKERGTTYSVCQGRHSICRPAG